MPCVHFITDTAHPGAWNMAFDEMLLEKVRTDPDMVFFRVYTWHPACFTIGYSQRLATELDTGICSGRGYDIVRRPTGGRSVLHADEIAFTCVTSPAGFAGRKNWSLTVGTLFKTTLERLEVRADLVDAGAPPPFARHAPSLCFTSAAQYEVLVDGKKLIGRAFREKGDYRLEQGFFLLKDGYRQLPSFVPGLSDSERTAMEKDVADKTVSLEGAGGIPVTPEELAGLLRESIGDAFGMDFSDYIPSDADRARTETLVAEKYSNPTWTERF